MKPLLIIGIALAAFGGFVLVRGLTYGTDKSVVKVGGLELSAEERRSIPAWVGGVALAGGLILAASALRGGRRG